MAETAITLKRAAMIDGKRQAAVDRDGKPVTISVAEAIAKALIKSGSAVAASSSSRKSTASSSSASASSSTESSGS